ncbi:MAG: hypothetical protein H7A46_12250 [Verrucomicrobiales bacterium]|nr:hypothetical protein [Verrucomicrobiales bacterium]
MPKDEYDPEDPLELCGVGLLTEEDTSEAMTECFIDEFLRLGHDARQVLALFRNRHYTGMNMVFQNRGEDFVRAKITEVFGWWKRPVSWEEASEETPPPAGDESRLPVAGDPHEGVEEQRHTQPLRDPMGNPMPSLD